MRARPVVPAALALSALLVARSADADDAQSPAANAESGGHGVQVEAPQQDSLLSASDWVGRRKHTIAELEVGFIALPNAPISQSERGGSLPGIGTIGHGDATASLGMHLLYRGGVDWAIGAGALFGPNPTSSTTNGNGSESTHSRDYLWMGGEARYIPLRLRTIEAWVGIAVGGIIVADRFTTTTPPVPSDLGTSQVTVRSEGFSLGLQVGGDWDVSEHFVLGLAVRFDNWILPTVPSLASTQCTPTGNCATLSGPVTEIEFGIRVGYRIPL
jgi:hypothetical protein